MDFAVAIAAGGLYFVLGRKLTGNLGTKVWFLRPAMLLICAASLANTVLGVWSAKVTGGLLGWVGGWFGASAALLAGVVGLLLLVGTALDLKDKRPDGIAKTGLITLPILVMVASGPLAAQGAGLFDSIAQAGANGLSTMIGG
ncbi:hypothetical protein [Actinomadura coerulea]|uniref:hypothetical protein n=1 Tax=Actinomadura coerulea TaxID=46159 RepID=UPI00342422CE